MRKNRLLHLLCSATIMISLLLGFSGCKKHGENALLVKRAFELLNDDNSNQLRAIVYDSPNNTFNKSDNNTNGGFIHVDDIMIEVEANTPHIIYYSCTVNGGAIVALSNVLNYDIYLKENQNYCKDITMKGYLTIRTNSITGKKEIDISNGQNPFSLFLNIVKSNRRAINKINFSQTTEEKLNEAINYSATIVGIAYANALEDDNSYFADVMIPELKSCKEVLELLILQKSLNDNYSNFFERSIGIKPAQKKTKIVIKDNSSGQKEIKAVVNDSNTVQKNTNSANNDNNSTEVQLWQKIMWILFASLIIFFLVLLIINKILINRRLKTMQKRISYKPQINAYLELAKRERKGVTNKASFTDIDPIKLSKKYSNKSDFLDIFGVKPNESFQFEKTSESGWALAALGKAISKNCTPQIFMENMKLFPKTSESFYYNIDLHNSLLRDVNKITERLKQHEDERNKQTRYNNELLQLLKGLNYSNLSDDINRIISKDLNYSDLSFHSVLTISVEEYNKLYSRYEVMISQLDKIREKIDYGILYYSLINGCLPFAYIMNIILDSQQHYDKFIRQGAIMGMIDFLVKYREDENIKPFFTQMLAVRSNIISSDTKMSFFEVRAPKNCTIELYSKILTEVLHSANPSIKYCNILKLMKIAQKEIPGILGLLTYHPLRLIDPGNKSTDGFYTYEPYLHTMWVRYTPPINVGQVVSRYHEVLDMTLPNSSGLNIRLFTDQYAAIPVMFHEYLHYLGDLNEASVHLKTHIFSIKFYKKYRKADPKKDFAFSALKNIFGNKVDPENHFVLNILISKYYGAQMPYEDAVKRAIEEVDNINNYIKINNIQEKWCPEILCPFLDDKEDKKHADMIKEIVIRYAQVPKSITKQEFLLSMDNVNPVTKKMYREWKKEELKWLMKPETKRIDGRTVRYFPEWKCFKDWCFKNNASISYTSSNFGIDYYYKEYMKNEKN